MKFTHSKEHIMRASEIKVGETYAATARRSPYARANRRIRVTRILSAAEFRRLTRVSGGEWGGGVLIPGDTVLSWHKVFRGHGAASYVIGVDPSTGVSVAYTSDLIARTADDQAIIDRVREGEELREKEDRERAMARREAVGALLSGHGIKVWGTLTNPRLSISISLEDAEKLALLLEPRMECACGGIVACLDCGEQGGEQGE